MNSKTFTRSLPLLAALGLAVPASLLAADARADGVWAERNTLRSTQGYHEVDRKDARHERDRRHERDQRWERDRDHRHSRGEEARYRHGYGHAYGYPPAYAWGHRRVWAPTVHYYPYPKPRYPHHHYDGRPYERSSIDLRIGYHIHY